MTRSGVPGRRESNAGLSDAQSRIKDTGADTSHSEDGHRPKEENR